MPVWAWIVLIGSLGLLVVSVLAIVPATHRLRSHKPLHGDPRDIAAPLPLQVAEAQNTTARELDEEHPSGEKDLSQSRGALSLDR